MLECSQRYVEVFLEIYSILFQSVVRDTFEFSRRYIGLQSLIYQSTCNNRYSQIYRGYVAFQPDIQSEIHVRWSVFIDMLKCSQRYVRVQSELYWWQSEICWWQSEICWWQLKICCSVVRDVFVCSQRYVGVKSEKWWSVTPEMVCCWQLENVVGSQRYVGGKQRYVGVQSEIFWSVVRDILECRYVAKKYVVLFFFFPELYIRVCCYLFRWHKETNCHNSFGIFGISSVCGNTYKQDYFAKEYRNQ